MRILHVLVPAPAGGLETAVQRLAAGQHRLGSDPHVAAIVLTESVWRTFVRPLAETGVDVHAVPLAPRAYLRQRAAVAALCRRLRPDVLHTHGYRADVLHVGTAHRMRIPAVTTVHGFVGGDRKNRLYERIQTFTFRRFDAVVAVSQGQVNELVRSGVPEGRIHLLPNAGGDALDPENPTAARRRLGVAVGQFHAGWVGRLSREKGPDILLDALAYLEDLPLVVSVVGDGPERERLRARASERGVDRHLRWHGMVPDAARLLTAFDVLVLSSRTEGVPMVLLEAMAAGVPIVATAVGGIPDVVTNDEAVLAPSENPLALAAAIRRVHDDPSGAQSRAVAARRRLHADFSVTQWVRGYDSVYRQARSTRRD
jgi:glycosyltransferase involved in cell wall biosynthesis